MAIDFPSSPVLNEQYTYGGQVYEWNGTVWRLVRTSVVGPTGPTGPTGATGPAGVFGGETMIMYTNLIPLTPQLLAMEIYSSIT